MNKSTLLFYISRYSGHFHAASAIEKSLLETIGGIRVEKINALQYTNPILEKILNKTYMEVIKNKPEIWGRMYDNEDLVKKTLKARKSLHKYNLPKMKKLIGPNHPDIIFCTQAFPCGMVAEYKEHLNDNTLLVGVLTDHAPHSYWIFDEVDYYIVPSEEAAEVFKGKGVPADKIKVYGIPVDPKFGKKQDRVQIKKELGFQEDKPVILIMGGSQGLGSIEETVRSLLQDTLHDYQILVVTGSNKKVYSRLSKIDYDANKKIIHIFTYVDNIDELMEASDIIITKAGGMTTAEALAKTLPILIINPIPGQERMNADYLTGKGAAVEVEDCSRIPDKINELFSEKNILCEMKQNIEKIAKPNSALDIAKLALDI